MMRVARDSRGNYFPMLVELTGRSLGASSNPCQLGKLFWDVIGVVEPIVLQSLEDNVFAVPWSRTRSFCLVQCEESVMVCGRGSALSRYRIRGLAIGSTSLQPLCSANLRYPISVMFAQCDNRAIRTPRYVALFFYGQTCRRNLFAFNSDNIGQTNTVAMSKRPDTCVSSLECARPRTRQRIHKPPPVIAVPDIDEDAAERKRVLNVLAQRRYSRGQSSILSAIW